MQPFDNNLYMSNFYKLWPEAKEREQLYFIKKAAQCSPGQGIIPVLAGINSYYFPVRDKSRQILSYLGSKLVKLLNNSSSHKNFLNALKESALFSARIYNELSSDLSVQEIKFYFEVLLESGGRGPFYAWKFWQSQGMSKATLTNIALAVSEKGRLMLVDQYLCAAPVERRKFAEEFKTILKSIEAHKSIVEFYAWLFDNKRYADPFLCHLNPDLTDPELIRSQYINSSDPELRMAGIKAMSMILPKIESSMLFAFIDDKKYPEIRKTAFKIIVNAPAGLYSELFETIYNFICAFKIPRSPNSSFFLPEMSEISGKMELPELLICFHALALCSPFSLPELITRIKSNAPFILQYIVEGISYFPELSLFFIMESAKNSAHFQALPSDIHKALIYGIIIKRPERILRILEEYGSVSNGSLSNATKEFALEIRKALAREKQAMDTEYSRIKAKYEKKSIINKNQSTNFIKSLFTDSAEKKIKLLEDGSLDNDIDFKGETIKNANFSSSKFDNLIIFDDCIINSSDLSNSTFLNSSFRKTVFFNVSLQKTTFTGVSFDNAVFIDINAEGAEFIKCSFQGASFFNTSFKASNMSGSIFIDSVLYRVSFTNAYLLDTSFACSRISYVFFTHSHLCNTDFTGIKARFCRFPSNGNLNIQTDYANLNARTFNFEKKNIPKVLLKAYKQNTVENKTFFMHDIDLLIFSECIHYGRKMFLKQNKLSLLTAFDIFKSKPCDLFEIVPVLIHGNINFPGYDAAKGNAPYGIARYLPSSETLIIASKYLSKESLKFSEHSDCYIESLFTIGSIGSIAQSSDSDIDYWVCIRNNGSENEKEKKARLQQKLDKLEKWALSMFKIEVHFFIVDIDKVKNDDFGTSSVECSGSAQGKILKEEFYRTMIYVAGKLPLWCALPVAVSRKYYDKLYSMICVNVQSCRYIDLGDIHEIPAGEYFGASIWQMFKWLKSPFKSVIKISLLDQFVQESGEKPLLCNIFKEKWMNPGLNFELSKFDPYYILVASLIRYYDKIGNMEAMRFIQLCFFLKTGISSKSDLNRGVFGFRRIFITQCMYEWGWNMDSVFKFGGFKSWQYENIMKLSLRIEKYMIDTYKRVRNGFDTGSKHNFLIKPEDKIALGRKIFVQFSDRPNKIKKILLISKDTDHFNGLSLRLRIDNKQGKFWELIHKSGRAIDMRKVDILKKTRTIEEIGAWLIYNGFYSKHTLINLVPNSTPVTYDEIKKLFDTMNDFFGKNLHETEFDVLLKEETIDLLFISINFSIPRNAKKLHECSVIYKNSWGEMFSTFIWEKNGFNSIDNVMKQIKQKLEIKSFPEKTIYYFPKKNKHSV